MDTAASYCFRVCWAADDDRSWQYPAVLVLRPPRRGGPTQMNDGGLSVWASFW